MPTEKRECPCKRLPMCLSSFTAAEYGDIHSLERSSAKRLDTVDSGGYTPLHLAAQNGHVAATSLLLQLGAKPDHNTSGATPLHRASFSGAIATMQVLLHEKWNCNLLAKDTSFGDGMTPLHKAAAGGRHLAVKLLLHTLRERRSNGNDNDSMLQQALHALDSFNRTPLDVAIELSKNQEEEQSSVKRWDAVAGGPADWHQCVELLKAAETEIQTGTTVNDGNDKKRSTLPALPKHLSGGLSCLDCNASGDGSCLTASWEEAFRSELSSLGSETCTVARQTPKLIAQQPELDASISCEPTETTPLETVSVDAPTKESESEQVGRTCDSCGAATFALYPSKGGGLVCRSCFKPTRTLRR